MMEKRFIKKRFYLIVSIIVGLIITMALYLDNLIKYGASNEYGIFGVIGFILVCLFTFLLVFGISYLICFIVFKIKLNHHNKS